MELDDLQDYAEPEYAIAAALLVAVFSPQARALVRRGAVYGLSGLLAAGDVIGGLAKRLQRGPQPSVPGFSFVQSMADEARAERRRAQAHADASPSGTSEASVQIEPF